MQPIKQIKMIVDFLSKLINLYEQKNNNGKIRNLFS